MIFVESCSKVFRDQKVFEELKRRFLVQPQMLRCMFPSESLKRSLEHDAEDEGANKRTKVGADFVVVPRSQWKWCNFGQQCQNRDKGCQYRHADGVDRNGRKVDDKTLPVQGDVGKGIDNKSTPAGAGIGLGTPTGGRGKGKK